MRVRVDVSDPDGDPVALSFTWLLDGRPVGSGTAKWLAAGAERGQQLEVRVVASDGRLDSEEARVRETLANRQPRVTGIQVAPGHAVTSGEIVEVTPRLADPDGDETVALYAWSVNGEAREGDTARFDTAGLSRGDELVVEVRAEDDDDIGPALASPPIRITNAPPRIVSTPVPPTADGFHYTVEAQDPDGDAPLHFSLEKSPDGMSIGALTGEIRWRPRAGQVGAHPVLIVVDDANGGRGAQAFDLQVGGPPAAVAP